jgi:hypothetical protein
LTVGSLLVVTSLFAAARGGSTQGPPPSVLAGILGPGNNAAVVRAEFADVNFRTARTLCRLSNTTASRSVVLKQVLVVGPGGIGAPTVTYNGLFGQILAPLASVDLAIDTSIPGVVLETTPGGPAVRQVVVVWDGDAEAVDLSASINSHYYSELMTRTEVMEHGVALRH